MLSKVCGRFTGVFGAIAVADDPTESRLEVTIDMASADSGDRAATTTCARPTSSTSSC